MLTKRTVARVVDGTVVTFTVVERHWLPKLLNAASVTVNGETVLCQRTVREQSDRNLRHWSHEAVHILQARRLGRRYLRTYLWQWLRHGLRKHKIPMEIEAFEKSGTW